MLTTLLALWVWQAARQWCCRPNVKKYSLMFNWVQAEQGWLKGVSEKQTKGDIIVLSGNNHHSNQTSRCMKSSSESFHCVSFPGSFCYNRCVWRTSAAVNCGSTGLFPMGLCAVFSQLYLFLAHDAKSTSHDFEISLPIQTLCMFIPLDLLFTLCCHAGNGVTEPSPEPLAVVTFGAEKHQIYPALFCHICSAMPQTH